MVIVCQKLLGILGQAVTSVPKGRVVITIAYSLIQAHAVDDTEGEPAPSIYRMIEEICDQSELTLVKVKIYESGDVLRANLYFTGKKDLVLRNHRASDAMALGAYYNIPILVRKKLLKERMEA